MSLAPFFRRVLAEWEERHAAILKTIRDRGGDFELAEKMVWKGNDPEPAIDLRKLPAEERPWLPPPGKEER